MTASPSSAPTATARSTFAKLLAGRLDADRPAKSAAAPACAVGYFAQHQDRRPGDGPPTPPSSTWPAPCRKGHAAPRSAAQLARFGLDADRANNKVAALSGGEKARLLLALATRDAPHLLILDEPTNHLDIDARDALVRALAAFEGAVLLITHDPHLVELVADRLWLVADGTVQPFAGDMDEYRALLSDRARPPKPEAPTKRDDRRDRAETRAQLAPLRKQAKDAETTLAKLADEKSRLETKLADPALYAPGRTTDVTTTNQRLAAIAQETEAAEQSWLEASQALESA